MELSEEVITLDIPAGVAEGMQLSLSGKGNAARRGGVNGDLIVLVEEQEHPQLVRDGNDLLYNVFVSFPEAVLGDSAEIPTLEGKVKVKVEPGNSAGEDPSVEREGFAGCKRVWERRFTGKSECMDPQEFIQRR